MIVAVNFIISAFERCSADAINRLREFHSSTPEAISKPKRQNKNDFANFINILDDITGNPQNVAFFIFICKFFV